MRQKKRQKAPEVVPAEKSLVERRPDLAGAAEDFAKKSLSESSHKATAADWKVFSEWCADQGVQSMPATASTAASFLVDQAKTKKLATLNRYRATVGKLHKLSKHPSPFADEGVKAVMEGICREKGVKQHQKAPVSLDLAASAAGTRDHAILLLGLATSCRGAELCGLDVSSIKFTDRGLEVDVRKSKTDQHGVGRTVAVPRLDGQPALCPTRAVRAWLAELPPGDGPLFRGFLRNGKPTLRRLGPKTVNRIVKDTAEAAGLDRKDFGAHSLRAGYVTMAREAEQDWSTIMEQTGHKRIETVKRYDRGARDAFKSSKVADVFEYASKKTPK